MLKKIGAAVSAVVIALTLVFAGASPGHAKRDTQWGGKVHHVHKDTQWGGKHVAKDTQWGG